MCGYHSNNNSSKCFMHFRSRVKNKTMLYWRFHKSNSSKIKYFLRSYKTLSLSDYFFKVTVIFFNTSHAFMSVELGTLLLCKLLKICPDVQILIILNYPFISFFISHLNAVYSGALMRAKRTWDRAPYS